LVGEVVEQTNADRGVDTASGKLSISDVDNGFSVKWSVVGTPNTTYGDIGIDQSTGQWTYKLDNTRQPTIALTQGQSVEVQYVFRATDEFGGYVDQVVTVTIVGRDSALPAVIPKPSLVIATTGDRDPADEEDVAETVVETRKPLGQYATMARFESSRIDLAKRPDQNVREHLVTPSAINPSLVDTSSMPLRNTLTPPDVMPDIENRVQYQLPEGTFMGGEGAIWLQATQRDGSPLPAWMQFDNATGRLEATVPEGLAGPVEIKIQARDANGDKAETIFRVQPRGDSLSFVGKPSLTAQFQQMIQQQM